MSGLLFALIATLIVGIGARDQVLVARLSERQGARPGILLVAGLSGVLAAALAAWAGSQVAGLMAAPARQFLVALALALGGVELIVLGPRRTPLEPTHSLGAFAIVVFALQLTDAARFLVFALAAMTRAPVAAGLGGAIGAAVVVGAGWVLFAQVQTRPIELVRRGIGAVLLFVGLMLAARAMGYL